MASSLHVGLNVDLGDLFKDLESVELGLGAELKKALARAAGTASVLTAQRMPRGPGAQSGVDNLPHIADTIASNATQQFAQVTTDHPGGPVLNWGGTIAPRGVEIHFPHKHYAQQAGDEVLPRIEQQLQDDIDELVARHLN